MRAVVIGLGVMGLPTARVLAERGHDVAGIDAHGIAAAAGSSSGDSRIFRVAHADAELVELAARAYERWQSLERRVGEELILRRGILERGDASDATSAALAAAGVAFERWTPADVTRRFGELAPRDVATVFQADAGTILARRALAAELRLARSAGAELAEGETVLAVEPRESGARVLTDGREIDADVVVVCAGPWLGELLAPLGWLPPLVAAEAQVTYFESPPDMIERPCLVEWHQAVEDCVYGMPTPRGYKLGLITWTRPWNPDGGEVVPDQSEVAEISRIAERTLPSLGPPIGSQACPVTLTADGKFILDRRGPVVVGGGCTGQGFKFMPLLGELLADLAEDRPRDPLAEQFRVDRPGLHEPIGSLRDLVMHGPAG